MTEIFHFLKFQEFINEYVEYVFFYQKWNFEPIGNFVHTTKFLTLGKALQILLPLYLQLLIMQISIQTGNRKYSEKIITKTNTLWIWHVETLIVPPFCCHNIRQYSKMETMKPLIAIIVKWS